MKKVMILLAGWLFLLSSASAAAACRGVELRARVEVGPGELSLADLLSAGNCPALYQAAAQVRLGAAPRAGSERVLEGQPVARQFERIFDAIKTRGASVEATENLLAPVPERIVVRLAETMMPCAGVAQFLAGAVRDIGSDPGWQNDLHCGGAASLPAGAALELVKSGWNPLLGRWEFSLRCAGREECVPFLVWSEAKGEDFSARAGRIRPEDAVVKRGETATLTWDQGGIRVVLPVTCLEAGGIGQSIRVRLENAGRTLRAEVVGAGALRVRL